jgi:hypothetical protein
VETAILLKHSLSQVPNHDLLVILCPFLLRFLRFRMHISQTLLTSVNFDLFILDFYFPFLVGLHVVDGIPKEKERAIGNIVSVKSACAM